MSLITTKRQSETLLMIDEQFINVASMYRTSLSNGSATLTSTFRSLKQKLSKIFKRPEDNIYPQFTLEDLLVLLKPLNNTVDKTGLKSYMTFNSDEHQPETNWIVVKQNPVICIHRYPSPYVPSNLSDTHRFSEKLAQEYKSAVLDATTYTLTYGFMTTKEISQAKLFDVIISLIYLIYRQKPYRYTTQQLESYINTVIEDTGSISFNKLERRFNTFLHNTVLNRQVREEQLKHNAEEGNKYRLRLSKIQEAVLNSLTHIDCSDHTIADLPTQFYKFNLDELDFVEFIMELEKRLDIQIPDDKFPHLEDTTLQEVVDYLMNETDAAE